MGRFFNDFRLPKDSYEQERIITPFALAFTQTDPLYEDKNAETMALAILFLNTIKHNKNVKNIDMDRESFLKYMTDKKEGYPDFPREELGRIYDRIVKKAFKTDTQSIEVIYQRVGAFLNYR